MLKLTIGTLIILLPNVKHGTASVGIIFIGHIDVRHLSVCITCC